MNNLPAEVLDTRELGRVAGVVPEVAGAGEQPAGRHLHARSEVGALELHRPARVRRRPGGRDHAMVQSDLLIDAVLRRCLPDVAQDLRTVGDRVLALPRLELEAERVQVGVRSDARVAKQVPGAAGRAARLEDREAPLGVLLLQVVGAADARDPGADDQYVDMFTPLSHVKVLPLQRALRPWKPPRRDAASAMTSGRLQNAKRTSVRPASLSS